MTNERKPMTASETPFALYLRGRETALGYFKFLAIAEEEARAAAETYGRDAYVLDERKGVHAEAVYRVRTK